MVSLCYIRFKIAPEQQLMYWYDGLKPQIFSKTDFDPITKRPYSNIEDAQSVALAVDFFMSGCSTAQPTGYPTGQPPKTGRNNGPSTSGGGDISFSYAAGQTKQNSH